MATKISKTAATGTAANPDRTVPIKVTFKVSLPNLPKLGTTVTYSSRKRFRKILRKAGYSIKNFELAKKGNVYFLQTVQVQAEPQAEPEATEA